MRISTSVSLLLCWLALCGAGRPALSNVAAQTATGRAAPSASANVPLTVSLEKELFRIGTPAGPALSNISVRLRFADGTVETRIPASPARREGKDAEGTYELTRYRLDGKEGSRPATAALELRRYAESRVVIAYLEYEGPPLAPVGGIQVVAALDDFARGVATKRLKLYWTAPVFTSDFRLLSPSNQLLLWRQMKADTFHLLAPLAGGGMIGELGAEDYAFRISLSSYDPRLSPRRVPLFAYVAGSDPYRLPRDLYAAAFAGGDYYGRPRWEKTYPEVFRSLGWCSWNTYYHGVSEEKLLNSARSLKERQIPVGFVLIDDGWLDVRNNRLAGYDANRSKFPRGLAGTVRALREQYGIRHVGIWHTFQGYWDGVDPASEIGREHALFTGLAEKALPDPREQRGRSFYEDWYAKLSSWGVDFVKIDNQASNSKFTNGLLPLFESGGGTQRNIQEAALRYFAGEGGGAGGLNIINCMEMSLESVFHWRHTNIARNSDDYLPDDPRNAKEHVYQNAYNAYWVSNFAYPDWDMFQTHDPHAEYHAIARAISGGPVYFTDEPGKEHADILRRLALSNGLLLRLDAPGQVTRDLLLADPALEPLPLKVAGRLTSAGGAAGMVAAFNVNKSAARVRGTIGIKDIEGWSETPARVALFRRLTGGVELLDAQRPALEFELGEFGYDLFTLAPVKEGVAVFGLLDKYLGPGAVVSESRERGEVIIRLREAGEFGAWLEKAPAQVSVDGQRLSSSAYSYANRMLRVPAASFGGGRPGEHEIRLRLS